MTTRLPSYILFGPNSRTPISASNPDTLEKLLLMTNRTVSEVEQADVALFSDFDNNALKEMRSLPARVKIVLIRNEPKVVRPQNHLPNFLECVDLIFMVGRPAEPDVLRANWPQTWSLSHLERSLPQKKLKQCRFILINANKLSFVPGELYSLRRQLVANSGDIDVFGPAWGSTAVEKGVKAIKELAIAVRYQTGVAPEALRGWFSKPLSYKGEARDKLGALTNYNYSLVIENSMEFMTEKLFDSLFAGTFPVYVGPKLELYGIPNFVALEADPTFHSVMAAMKAARDVDIDVWRKRTLDWLRSEGVEQQWSSKYVIPKMINIIDRELGKLEHNHDLS